MVFFSLSKVLWEEFSAVSEKYHGLRGNLWGGMEKEKKCMI